MKAHILIVAALLAWGTTAYASDGRFSLEIGTGLQPLHMTLAPTHAEEKALAELSEIQVLSARYSAFPESGA